MCILHIESQVYILHNLALFHCSDIWHDTLQNSAMNRMQICQTRCSIFESCTLHMLDPYLSVFFISMLRCLEMVQSMCLVTVIHLPQKHHIIILRRIPWFGGARLGSLSSTSRIRTKCILPATKQAQDATPINESIRKTRAANVTCK